MKLAGFALDSLDPDRVGLPPAAVQRLGLRPGQGLRLASTRPDGPYQHAAGWQGADDLGPDGCWLAPLVLEQLQLDDGELLEVTPVHVPQPWFWTFFWDCARPERQRRGEDLLLVLDTSGSMVGQPLFRARRALLALLGRMQELERDLDGTANRSRIGLLTFGGDVALHCPPAEDNLSDLQRAVQEVQAGGGTPMATALHHALDALSAPADAPPAEARARRVLLLTDGHPSEPRTEVEALIGPYRQHGVEIWTVGVGEHFDRRLLGRLAAATQGSFVEVQRFQELVLALEELA